MPISNKIAHGVDEVDVIICGGGVAACVVAGRLAAADPKLEVLMIEGGENNAGNPLVENPALFPQHLVPASKTAVWYKAKKSEQLDGREYMLPTGGLLGGGSSVNIMLFVVDGETRREAYAKCTRYSRPAKGDFDTWKTPGWSTEEMMPFMRKLETYTGRGDPAYHGNDGPLRVTNESFRMKKTEDDLLRAIEQLGFPIIDDLQDTAIGNLGFERQVKTVTTEGKRLDAATAYIHPLLNDGQHPNLHVLCESKVIRVLFDEHKRAVGVEYTPNPEYMIISTATERARMTVKARKMVVISCGALGSPLILERSGVGSPDILEQASVSLVADVPGVGSDYQDHNLVFWPFKTNLGPADTLDALWSGRMSPEEAVANRLMQYSGCDMHGKYRPSKEEIKEMGPEFEKHWKAEYQDYPSKPLMITASAAAFVGDPSLVPAGAYYSLGSYTAYPKSRGHIHITGPNWEDPPDLETGFFTEAVDVTKQIYAYKVIREMMRRTSMYRGELPIGHPEFPAGSEAVLVDLDAPLAGDFEKPLGKIKYTPEDDKAIEKFLRKHIGTTWHSLGTCAMKPRHEGGVVDKTLNVYGTQGLKVVDLSICPENVAANTQITAYTVGEKGADIIMRELGLADAKQEGMNLNGCAH
ncbi:hypothetical protein LTR29_005386 [Friedmanniomyces endolithicus]|uniref:Glucose-methanol-choline oxidoreductase N-terminal domain-containing protein n=1 Tax=Friedmanniomyces endolithicus TaxID=329885 RepID=A0A4U0VA14_9PEZI|nr:hypothetical protein LTS09_015152 [Friedmanniomyces endolithicus]KAK0336026.1 hypothetical protein LTR94_010278 [Friedmanniomyces endolithicus]KAK0773398.1 hypothetical protein LTR59_015299 [Friedmanniomyces endolithicus]KAK0794992.1 hypothetical protein LTR38_009090 [Friedmanniomyces endolithicus]KAK0819362.1 hypothetical protein LTR75_002131 [Friedmanniomyces endolithicus]